MFKLYLNHVQLGTYETENVFNAAVGGVFACARVTGMKASAEDGCFSVWLEQED